MNKNINVLTEINKAFRGTPEYQTMLRQALKNTENLDVFLDSLWMEIGDVRKLKYDNKLLYPEWDDYNKIPENIVRLCLRSEYLHFTTKYILNLDILPYQAVILDTFWHKPLPLLVGSRGMAKSFLLAVYCILRALLSQGCNIAIVGASFRQSKVIYNYIQQIYNNAPVLQDIVRNEPKIGLDMASWSVGNSKIIALPLGTGEKIRGQRANVVIADEIACCSYNTLVETDRGLLRLGECIENGRSDFKILNRKGQWEKPMRYHKTALTDVYRITTVNGYSFKCSKIHQVLTTNGWKLAKDLTTDDYLIYDNKYIFPTDYVIYENIVVDEKLGYLIGLLISEGTLTNKNMICITTTDERLKNFLMDEYKDFNIKCYISTPKYDKRFGTTCKTKYDLRIHSTRLRNCLEKLGLNKVTSHYKTTPWCILESPKSVLLAYLKGLFEGDGSAFKVKCRNKIKFAVSYYSVSEQLVDELQIILFKLDLLSNKGSRYSKLSDKKQWMLCLHGENAAKLYHLLKISKWDEAYHNSYIFERKKRIGVTYYNGLYYARPYYEGKDRYLGKFNTEHEAFAKVDEFWSSHQKGIKVSSVCLLPIKECLYDFELPESQSWYGNCFVQHNSVSKVIFETVVRGFAAVKSQGVHGNVVEEYKKDVEKLYNEMYNDGPRTPDLVTELGIDNIMKSNQIILSGTASYEFNHFYEYWLMYSAIIKHGGNVKSIYEEYGDKLKFDRHDNIDANNYAVIRMPYDVLPPGLMDPVILTQGKATMDKQIFLMEYGAVYCKDSEGYYLASWLERATCPIKDDSNELVINFGPALVGNPEKEYIVGIDPGSEDDNFAVAVIEKNTNYKALRYMWTTNRKEFENLRKDENQPISSDIKDYHTFCIKILRGILRRFNCKMFVLDSGGGGVSIREGLRDPDKLLDENDDLIYDMDDDDVKGLKGLHILKVVEFSDYKWRREAHTGLRKDLLEMKILFPNYDLAEVALSSYRDSKMGKIYDTIEDVHLEILQCKQETALIKRTETSTGQEKWDVPKIVGLNSEEVKKQLKKDRFTALMLANWGWRFVDQNDYPVSVDFVGGVAQNYGKDKQNLSGPMYVGKGAARMKNIGHVGGLVGGRDSQQSNGHRRIFY